MALLLRDAGMEVIYTGIRNSIDAIVQAAIQEDVHIIGLSVLSGAHLGLAQQVITHLRAKDLEDIKVVMGGVSSYRGHRNAQGIGIAAVFPGGTPFAAIIAEIRALVSGA